MKKIKPEMNSNSRSNSPGGGARSDRSGSNYSGKKPSNKLKYGDRHRSNSSGRGMPR